MLKAKILYAHEIPTTKCRVDLKLQELGYRIDSTETTALSHFRSTRYEFLVLDVPACRLKRSLKDANDCFSLPIFWWCEERKPATAAPYEKVDGILCCGMNDNELQWSLLLGIKNYQRRLHLEREYAHLSTKFDERIAIEDAKIMLSKQYNISEISAYEMMRKQAMNERRKLADVARSVLGERSEDKTGIGSNRVDHPPFGMLI